ncbi:uncharacterized protein HNR76_001055 [Pseudoxanthomonas broegbernensis]|nr:uncharacterized protein [Pseudoxanthomonas broegbernensis]
MVATGRRFEGGVPLSAMARLGGSLADAEGECRFALEFGCDALQVPFVELSIEAGLPLVCQRSLERFVFPVKSVQRLGLIRDEADDAALPPGYEALLVPEDGQLRPLDLVEDELVLALPVVPVAPDSRPIDHTWSAGEEEQQAASPFAALASLKKRQ